MYTIIHYLDENERDIYQSWLNELLDRTIALIRRVARLELGLFGDCKSLQGGVSELRIDVGAGYRIYYAQVGNQIILLTNGGDKKSQSRDIERAIYLLQNWRQRHGKD